MISSFTQEDDSGNAVSILADQYYNQEIDPDRLAEVHQQYDKINSADLYAKKKNSSQDKTNADVELLFKQSKPVHQELLKFNLSKNVELVRPLYIRDNFKQLSDNLHTDFINYTQQSQRLVFNQKHYDGNKQFQFMQPQPQTSNQTSKTNARQSSTPDIIRQKPINFEPAQPQTYEYDYANSKIRIKTGHGFDVRQIQSHIKKQVIEKEESQKKIEILNSQEVPIECEIKSIFQYKEPGGIEKLPSDLTKELFQCFVEAQEFFEQLDEDDEGNYVLGDWEISMFHQMKTKRAKVLQEDVVDKGRKAQIGSQFSRINETGGHRLGLQNLERDMDLFFYDEQLIPLNKQAINEIEDVEFDIENLQFKDITNFIAERISPEQLLYGVEIAKQLKKRKTQDYLQHFDSFQAQQQEMDETTKTKRKEGYKEIEIQTEDLNPIKKKDQKDEKTVRKGLTFFERIKKEVNQIKQHKIRYQSDKTYVNLLNNHIIKKLNELWQLVSDEEEQFQVYQTLQENIAAIYQYVDQLRDHHTIEGDAKLQVLLWLMQEFKQVVEETEKLGPLNVLKRGTHQQSLVVNQISEDLQTQAKLLQAEQKETTRAKPQKSYSQPKFKKKEG